MAGMSRLVRLQGKVDTYIDQLETDAAAIAGDLSDGVVTPDERVRIELAIARMREALGEIDTEVMVIGDAHQLAHEALGAGAVTPWVTRRAREKGADYLRLVKPRRRARVLVFRQRVTHATSVAEAT